MQDVDIEQLNTETYMVSPSGEATAAERAEQKLVLRYRDQMAAKGIVVRRKRYLPAGEVRPIYSDAWVEDRRAPRLSVAQLLAGKAANAVRR